MAEPVEEPSHFSDEQMLAQKDDDDDDDDDLTETGETDDKDDTISEDEGTCIYV